MRLALLLWNAARSALLRVTTSSAVHKSTMSRLWQILNKIGAPADRPRSGRPRITTHALDRYIWVFHLRGRPRRPFVGPVLTQIHRRARARWCHAFRACTLRNWCWIWINDVSHFLLSFGPTWVQEVNRFGGGSVMMLAAISYNCRTNIVRVQGNLTAQGNRNNILRPYMPNAIDRQREMFQQENSRSHITRVIVDLLTQKNITVLTWPWKSPYLNPVEHLWDELDRHVRQCQPSPQLLDQLSEALQHG